MVISTAMPNATLNTKTVDGFNGTPTQPITPAVITSGITFGIKEQKRMRNDLKRYNIQRAINKKAQKILSSRPCTIKRLPSRKVILVPVSCTVYLVVSKISAAFCSIPASKTGNFCVPTSAIFILMRVLCRVLSIKLVIIFARLCSCRCRPGPDADTQLQKRHQSCWAVNNWQNHLQKTPAWQISCPRQHLAACSFLFVQQYMLTTHPLSQKAKARESSYPVWFFGIYHNFKRHHAIESFFQKTLSRYKPYLFLAGHQQ